MSSTRSWLTRQMRRALLPGVVFTLGLVAPRASLFAQTDVPSLRWQTITTPHFRIHYEPELEAWARQVAERIESVRTAVAERVGYTYPHTIDLIVEDPLNVANGSAFPSLTYPVMRFWATPPAPTSVIGNSRGWGEILSVHEYAHLAHLLRPSRKPFALLSSLWGIIPVGPITGAPAWVSEGYATVIEGELTGSGRPNSAQRPAILRTLALDGYLPAYGALDATDRFNGGAMRYLVGSAFLEWLQSRRGDNSLPELWRRATARTERKFPAAFTATFGESPDVLYGRFAAEVTERAVAVRTQLQQQGLAAGTLVQRWERAVGSPDVSPDGMRLAVARDTRADPGAITVLSLTPDTARIRKDSVATAKRLKKDPEDLADYRAYPRALKRVAVLRPVNGNAYDAPRWMPDGEHILVTRRVPLADGRARSDLFAWHVASERVRRITTGAGIVLADPTLDGKSAAAVRCGAGVCSLLLVDLASGEQRTLAEGTLDGSYAGARVSPNGRFVASAQQRGARWVPVVIEIASGAARTLGPNDQASRYSPAWENDSTLVVMSDASGGIEIERLPLHGGDITVAVRTVGMANAPEVGPDGRIWWLDLHGRGWDLRVNEARSTVPVAPPLDDTQFPAAKRVDTRLARQFEPDSLRAPARYGAGPFGIAFLALGTEGADGGVRAAGATFGDPVGRGTGLAYAGIGDDGAWSGARVAYTWRGFRPAIRLEGFRAEYLPSEQPGKRALGWEPWDRRFDGIALSADLSTTNSYVTTSTRVGGAIGRTTNPTLDLPSRARTLIVAQTTGQVRGLPPLSVPRASIVMQWDATNSVGWSEGGDWRRTTVDTRVAFEIRQTGLALRARGGEVNAGTPFAEQFVVGGTASPFMDPLLITNRVEHIGLPFGILGGRRFGILTAETAGPLRLYHDWMVGGNRAFGETLRVIGAEVVTDIPRMAAMRIPAIRLRVGLNHSVNGPLRNATHGYVSLNVAP